MWSIGEFLAGDAMSHDFLHVFHGCGPIEPCSECFGHEHPTARVLSAGAFVNFEQQGFAVLFVDALLEYLCDAALV